MKKIALIPIIILGFLHVNKVQAQQSDSLVLKGLSLSCGAPTGLIETRYYIDHANQRIQETGDEVGAGVFSIKTFVTQQQQHSISVNGLGGDRLPISQSPFISINCPVSGQGQKLIKKVIRSRDGQVKYRVSFTMKVNGLTASLSDMIFTQIAPPKALPAINILVN